MRISFGLKMGLSICLLAVGSTGISLYFFYLNSNKIALQQMRSHLQVLAHTGTFLFNNKDRKIMQDLVIELNKSSLPVNQKILDLESGQTAASLTEQQQSAFHNQKNFLHLVQILRRIKQSSQRNIKSITYIHKVAPDPEDLPLLRYAYLLTAIPESADYKITKFIADADWDVVDTNKNGKIDPAEMDDSNPVGSLYSYKVDNLLSNAFKGNIDVNQEWYTDQWGTFITAAAPVLDDKGQVIAILGLDLDVTGQANNLLVLKKYLFFIVGISILLSILLSAVLSNLLSRPIKLLHTGAEKIRQRNFTASVNIKNQDEFGELASAFNQMSHEIREYSESLESTNRELQSKVIQLDAARIEIQNSETRYRHLVEGSNEIIFSLKEDFSIQSVSKSVRTHLGHKQKNLIGKSLLDFVHTSDEHDVFSARDILIDSLHKVIQSQKNTILRIEFNTILNEPKEMEMRLEYVHMKDDFLIFAKVALIPEDTLAKYRITELFSYEIDNYITLAIQVVNSVLKYLSIHLNEDEKQNLRLGVHEILVNAIEHGNLNISYDEKSRATLDDSYFDLLKRRQSIPEYMNRKVHIIYSRKPNRISFLVSDQGTGFDHSHMINKKNLPAASTFHGRGIFLTKEVFDVVRYNKKGNKVLLVKYIK